MFENRRRCFRQVPEPWSYAEPVPLSARDVAAVLRDRDPGLSTKKLHKLLYYCQGHHVATFGTPLFEERISAWDMGPVVGELWYGEKTSGRSAAARQLDEGELNTVGYVLSRYGALTGQDLESLTHSERPWRLANAYRQSHGSARIEIDWIRDYFAAEGRGGEQDDDDVVLDSADVAEWLRGASERRGDPVGSDDPDAVAERLRLLHARIQGRG